jgi:CheY-like chemotaxis protein
LLKLNLKAEAYDTRGDAVRLQQVFWNILKNAVKFTPSRGTISISSRTEKNELVVSVSDSGIGMTPEELTQAFDAFSQGKQNLSKQFGGLGLGLAISRSIVGAHCGRIWAESDGPQKGATLIIALPLIQKTLELSARAPVKNGTIHVSTPNRKQSLSILLVEDHEPTRATLTELLARRCHRVVPVATVKEARALASKEKFDVLISDIGLPDGNGADLMRELSVQKQLKGIALTGYGMEQDIAKSQLAGFIAHLTKPVRIESLDNTLSEMI